MPTKLQVLLLDWSKQHHALPMYLGYWGVCVVLGVSSRMYHDGMALHCLLSSLQCNATCNKYLRIVVL